MDRPRAEFLLPIFATALLAGVPRASAGTPMCIDDTAASRNIAALEVEAVRAAGGHVLDWKTMWVCITPVGRLALIEAKPEPQPDGSELRPVARCDGTSKDWHCAMESARHAQFSLPIAGRAQRFDLRIPAAFTPENARRLTARAFEEAPRLTWKDHCFARRDEPAPVWGKGAERDMHVAFGPRKGMVRGSIDELADGTAISIDLSMLTFTRAPVSSEEKELRCWNEIVAVT